MEIAAFDYTVEDGKMSSSIGILPGAAGYWTISFKDALWNLRDGALQDAADGQC